MENGYEPNLIPEQDTTVDAAALLDQLSALITLCAETNASAKRTEATVAQLAEVLKQFSEVNPQELMGLLGSMMGK